MPDPCGTPSHTLPAPPVPFPSREAERAPTPVKRVWALLFSSLEHSALVRPSREQSRCRRVSSSVTVPLTAHGQRQTEEVTERGQQGQQARHAVHQAGWVCATAPPAI